MHARNPNGPVPPNLRDVSFRTAVRGYERREVDRYVERANHLIAELEITRSPESAVRHALERVGEQTSGILQRAPPETIAEERLRLVEEVRELAARLEAVADSGTPAAARVASATASASRDGSEEHVPTGVEVWHEQQADG